MFCYFKAKAASLPALAAALAIAAQPAALAQTQAPTKALEPASAQRVDPADPKATVPPSIYRSSLSGYQAFTQTDVAPWRDTNESVRQRGGWRAYAREAREPASTTTPSPAAPAASQPAADVKAKPGHAGHEIK